MLSYPVREPQSIPVKCKTAVLIASGSSIQDAFLRCWTQNQFTGLKDFHLKQLTLDEISSLDKMQPDAVVLACDTRDTAFEHTVLEKCRSMSLPVFPVLGKGSAVLIGPLEVPEREGCITCLQLRWEHSMLRTKFRLAVKDKQTASPDFVVQLSMTPSELIPVAQTALNEIQALLNLEPHHDDNTVGIYHRDGSQEWVPLLPSHDCPRCRLRPIDDSNFGRLSLQHGKVTDKQSLRSRKVTYDELRTLYVHRGVGYISSMSDFGVEGEYVRASAYVQTPFGASHVGHGSGFTKVEARKKAVLEVIERLCAVHATDRMPVVFASYSELGRDAVNPLSFGLHDDEFFQTASTWFEPYSSQKRYSWVWSYSTKLQRPVLIPEQIAYYGGTRDTKRFLKDSSNGCALGTTMEEATLFGIFEVLERDGFLNMWYGKMSVPELELGDNCPEDVYRVYRLIRDKGYDVRFFNLSHDTEIPVVLAVAIGTGIRGPAVVSGTSCHLNAYEAVNGSLRELMVQIMHTESITEARREQGREMLRNPKMIRDILDHVVAASVPEAIPRWKFLLDPRDKVHSIEDVYRTTSSRFNVESGDILTILGAVLTSLHQKGFDVIVVNQTNVEALRGGFVAVKAMIPGMTPITFGYGSRRVQGLKRVFELPYRLGYSNRILSSADLNVDCHPFS